MPWLVQARTTIWAPFGQTGWSAIEVTEVSRVWGRGHRVNPSSQKHGAKGKFRIEWVISRNPKLKGKDKPHVPPSIALAHLKVKKELEPVPMKKEIVVEEPKPVVQRTPKEESATRKKLNKLFDLLKDKSTDEDW